jgi:hypothetical protein
MLTPKTLHTLISDEWPVNGSRRGDTVVFYFAGHGSQVEDFNGDEHDGYDEVLCPYDMAPHGGRNLILDDDLGLWLQKLNGQRVLRRIFLWAFGAHTG